MASGENATECSKDCIEQRPNGEHLDNIDLLKGRQAFRGEYDFPVLWGVSRKSMIGQITGHSTTEERLYGTLGVAAYANQVGIDWLRVHDVQAHTDVLNVLDVLD